jgi:hypothetical protein
VQASAGKLSDFEAEAARDDDAEKNEQPPKQDAYDDNDNREYRRRRYYRRRYPRRHWTYGLLTPPLVVSRETRVESVNPSTVPPYRPRMPGDPLIPFIRYDFSVQDVESDVEAFDHRFEGGYGLFAFQIRNTRYREDEPSDDLDLFQIHFLLRLYFDESFEMDLGLGSLRIDGEEANSGASFTLPVHFYPTRRLGVVFRPAWANVNENTIEDYDLAIVYRFPFAALRAGYRWVMSGSESLDGFYLGASLCY